MLPINQIIQGDCRQVMRGFPSESIDMVMFSPPYYGLRDYGKETETIYGADENCQHEWVTERTYRPNQAGGTDEKRAIKGKLNYSEAVDYNDRATYSSFCKKCGAWRGQLGLEPDWRMYVNHMVEICREIKRVLKKTGSMYIVIGDSYFGGRGCNDYREVKNFRTKIDYEFRRNLDKKDSIYKPKCLMGIPWRVAFALIEDGWILRNDIIWYKPNAMPSSARDRLTQTYEHIFHFVKNKKYYYNLDAIREPHKRDWRYSGGALCPSKTRPFGTGWATKVGRHDDVRRKPPQMNPLGKNPGDVIIDNFDERIRKLIQALHQIAQTIRGTTDYKGKISDYSPSKLRQYCKAYRDALKILEQKIPLSREEKDFLLDYVRNHGGHPLGRNPGDFVTLNEYEYETEDEVSDELWSIATQPSEVEHFAVYPEQLCVRPILSSCPPNGIVLDPMCGTGTTCLVALKMNRRFIGIEINPKYVEIAKKKLKPYIEQTKLFEPIIFDFAEEPEEIQFDFADEEITFEFE